MKEHSGVWVLGDLVLCDLLLHDSDLYDGTGGLVGGESKRLGKFHRLCVGVYSQLTWSVSLGFGVQDRTQCLGHARQTRQAFCGWITSQLPATLPALLLR